MVARWPVGELELAGQDLGDPAERGPVARGQRRIAGRQHGERRAGIVGERKLRGRGDASFPDQGICFARKLRRAGGGGTALVKSSCIALFVIRGVQVWKS